MFKHFLMLSKQLRANEEVNPHLTSAHLCVYCCKMLNFFIVLLCFQSMATAVAQLFMALPHSPSTWSLQHTGVVSFVKDNPRRSYFIRMFDLKVTSWPKMHVDL